MLKTDELHVNTVTGSKCSMKDENSSMLWHKRLGHIYLGHPLN